MAHRPKHTNRWQTNFMGSSHLIPASRWLVPPMLSLDIFLVGGFFPILKNDGVRQWEGWHPIYEMDNTPNVWNHQPDQISIVFLGLGNKHQWISFICRCFSYQKTQEHLGVSRIGGRTPPTWWLFSGPPGPPNLCRCCPWNPHRTTPWRLLSIDWFRGTFTWNHGYPQTNITNWKITTLFMGKSTINHHFQ